MSGFKLTYFDVRARAEPIRYLFALAGQEYEDCRVGGPTWQALKPTLPMGQLPILEHNGITLCQVTAIANYVARELGLSGKNECERAICDMIFSTFIEDILRAGQKMRFSSEEDKASTTANFEQTVANFSKLVEANKKGKFILGDEISLADIGVMHAVDMVDFLHPGTSCKHSNLVDLANLVKENPKIAQWIKDRPVTSK